jgi:ATP-dependent Clp protease protease subunit
MDAGLAIYDALRASRCDVATLCFRLAASLGGVLPAAGASGKRTMLPNARLMIHHGSG